MLNWGTAQGEQRQLFSYSHLRLTKRNLLGVYFASTSTGTSLSFGGAVPMVPSCRRHCEMRRVSECEQRPRVAQSLCLGSQFYSPSLCEYSVLHLVVFLATQLQWTRWQRDLSRCCTVMGEVAPSRGPQLCTLTMLQKTCCPCRSAPRMRAQNQLSTRCCPMVFYRPSLCCASFLALMQIVVVSEMVISTSRHCRVHEGLLQ
jgi:hypothetical protein